MSEHFSAEFFRSSSVAWALPFRWPTSTFWMLVRCPRTDCLCSSSWLSWAIILASSVGSSTSSCAAWICVSSVSFWITSQNSESNIHVKHTEKTFVLEDSTFNATTWYHHSHDRDGLIQQKQNHLNHKMIFEHASGGACPGSKRSSELTNIRWLLWRGCTFGNLYLSLKWVLSVALSAFRWAKLASRSCLYETKHTSSHLRVGT